jgi:hypothetical protein
LFQERGIEGLKDKRRSSRPATIDSKKKTAVIALACFKPPNGKAKTKLIALEDEVL